MLQMNPVLLSSFICYLTIILSIAFLAYYITRNLADFVLGGRQLGGPVAALSVGTADMSTWLLLGLPGAVFVFGLNQIWLPIGLTLGAFVSWRWVAKPLRVFSEQANDSLTIPAFLAHRFFEQNGVLRMLGAIVTLFFFAVYTAAGLVAAAVLLQEFNIPFGKALLISTAIIAGYTVIGGFLALSWAALFQGILMLICLLTIPFVASQNYGGWGKIIEQISVHGPQHLDPFHDFNGVIFVNLMAWGLGYLGAPHILVRFMAVSSTADIPVARRICLSWMILSLLGAVLTGFVGIAYFYEHDINPESIFMVFSQSLFSPWIAGALFAAVLSSIMCAIDAQMLVSSSALTEDVYHRFFRKEASQKELLWVARLGIIMIAAITLYWAFHRERAVMTLVAFAWAGLGASFGPAVIGALFWRRMTARGAMTGMLLGALTVVFWQYNSTESGLFSFYEIIPGFLLGTVGVIIGSLLDAPPIVPILKQFDAAWTAIRQSPNERSQ